MSAARILITGASGLLGRKVLQHFQNELSNKWTCLGLCFSRNKNESLRSCDLTNFSQINALVDEFKPNVIVHCAAERKVEAVENNFDGTLKLNVDATKNLAELSAKLGILFIYISTDYVFDGTKPPYKISDQPNPLNRYGISKHEGEITTLQASKGHCVLRVPILYSDGLETLSESAVTVLFDSVKKVGVSCKMDNVQARYPTDCHDIARFLAVLIQKRLEGDDTVQGIFHCASPERYTKYDIACLMADLFNLPKSHIVADMSSADPTIKQLRPMDSQLDTIYSFEKLNGFRTIVDFKTSLKRALEPFQN